MPSPAGGVHLITLGAKRRTRIESPDPRTEGPITTRLQQETRLALAVSVSRCGATPDKSQSWAIPRDGGRDSLGANKIPVRNIPRRTERQPEVEPMAAWRK